MSEEAPGKRARSDGAPKRRARQLTPLGVFRRNIRGRAKTLKLKIRKNQKELKILNRDIARLRGR